MTFWLNGEWREEKTAISIADRGFLLGDGLFETIFMKNGAAAFLDDHLARLSAGLQMLGINASSPGNIAAILAELAERNGLTDKVAAARISMSRGVSERGLLFPEGSDPTVLITASPAAIAGGSAALIVSAYRRSQHSVAARCKASAYLDNVLARNEARDRSVDEAIMLNGEGRVACASSANLFLILKDGSVVTPPVGEGALPGIIRGMLLAAAPEIGAEIREDAIRLDDLRRGALFLTNSLIGLRPAFLQGEKPPASELFIRLSAWYENRLADSLREGSSRL